VNAATIDASKKRFAVFIYEIRQEVVLRMSSPRTTPKPRRFRTVLREPLN